MSIGNDGTTQQGAPKFSSDFKGVEGGEIELSVSGPQGKTNVMVKIAAKHIKPKGLGENKSISKHVTIKVTNKKDGVVHEVSVKAKHLAKGLGIAQKEMPTDKADLNTFIMNKLGAIDPFDGSADTNVFSGTPENSRETSTFSSSTSKNTESPNSLPLPPKIPLSADPFAIPRAPTNLKKEFGLRNEEYETICNFYEANHKLLNAEVEEASHIRKSWTNPPLPRSVVYVPRKGLYILCKTKGGAKEVGIGSYNLATKMLHIDTGEKKIFRNGKKDHVPEEEIRANEKFKKIDPSGKHFATGEVVRYVGPWRARQSGGKRKLNQSKKDLPPKKIVEKIGLIMDLIPGGELFDIVKTHPLNRYQTPKENIGICLDIAKGLVISHAVGLVNLDIKPQNIFMGGPGILNPKIGDFGMIYNVGDEINHLCGTQGYFSPEMLNAEYSPFVVEEKNEMWIMGCMMAITTKGFDFNTLVDQISNPYKILYLGKHEFTNIVHKIFPEYKTEVSIDNAIVKCLSWNPKDRLSAAELVPILQKLYDT